MCKPKKPRIDPPPPLPAFEPPPQLKLGGDEDSAERKQVNALRIGRQSLLAKRSPRPFSDLNPNPARLGVLSELNVQIQRPDKNDSFPQSRREFVPDGKGGFLEIKFTDRNGNRTTPPRFQNPSAPAPQTPSNDGGFDISNPDGLRDALKDLPDLTG